MRWSFAWLMLAACNQLLGQEGAEQVASVDDPDADGLVGELDNCPDVANADQLDSDRDGDGDACDSCPVTLPTRDLDEDGIDDACDRCLLGPEVDDDGDGAMDACDLCPISASGDGDLDGDLVGDACDTSGIAFSEHVLVERFETLDARQWNGTSSWEHDPLTTSIFASSGSLTLLSNPPVLNAASVRYAVVGDGRISVEFDSVTCSVECASGECVLELSVEPAMQAIVSASGGLRLQHLPPPTFGSVPIPKVRCEVLEGKVLDGLDPNTTSPFVVEATNARISGVDLVR